MSNFSDRLREVQSQNKYNQKQMADMLGIAPTTFAAYLNGSDTPTLEESIEIADKLDVSVSWLCKDKRCEAQTLATHTDVFRAVVALVEKTPFIIRSNGTLAYKGSDSDKMLALLKEYYDIERLHTLGTINDKLYQIWLDGKYADNKDEPNSYVSTVKSEVTSK